jgi:hypothetical protein
MTENVPTYPDLQGKVALVTGGSGGIGAATCRLLAAPFLASESSSWITGVTLDVAGGRIMHRTKPAGGARVGARRGGDGKDHRRSSRPGTTSCLAWGSRASGLLLEGLSVAGRRHPHLAPEVQPQGRARAETAILRYALHGVLGGLQPALGGEDPLL